MNKSKKAIVRPQKMKETKKKVNPKVWIILTSILGVILAGAILFDQLYKRPLIKVDGEKYNLEDLKYYIYTVESSYDYINQMYGGNYWDMPSSESSNITIRQAALEEAINKSLYNEIMYNEAKKKNYTLTKEEENQISTDITDMIYKQGLSEKMIKENGFTGDYLTKVLTKLALIKRYKQDVTDSLDIDDEAIKAEFKYEDYRQYDIEYLYISTQTTNDAGESVAMNETDKKAAYDKISAQYDKAKTAKDWSTLVPEGEEQLQYQKNSFIETDTNFPEEFLTMMKGMENNAISDVYETDDGYYIVRMLNNNSSASYDNAVKNAITDAENEGFQKVYQEEILPKHSYKTYKNAISALKMGTITLVD